jgi:tetratricopeptide (TPR) repeat protein
VWDAETGELLATLVGHHQSVMSVAFSRDSVGGQSINSMDITGRVLVWPAATNAEVEMEAQYWKARSKRHEDLGDKENSAADLARSLQLSAKHDSLDIDQFRDFNSAGNWSEAAKVGRRMADASPDNTLLWLRVAPAFVLAGDRSGYREFCNRLAEHFAGTIDVRAAEHVCRACLLMPNGIELERLPHSVLAKSLDVVEQDPMLAPWLWASHGLLAYRSGDSQSALAYVQESEELNPLRITHALNLAIRALAHHQLGQVGTSRDEIQQASNTLDDAVKRDPGLRHAHDVLIPRILLEEVQAKIDGKHMP